MKKRRYVCIRSAWEQGAKRLHCFQNQCSCKVQPIVYVGSAQVIIIGLSHKIKTFEFCPLLATFSPAEIAPRIFYVKISDPISKMVMRLVVILFLSKQVKVSEKGRAHSSFSHTGKDVFGQQVKQTAADSRRQHLVEEQVSHPLVRISDVLHLVLLT